MTIIDGIATFDFSGDLSERAKALGGRKVRRLLERLSVPPFVAANELLVRHAHLDRTDMALVTVAGWEPDIPPVIASHDGSLGSRERQALQYQQLVNPTQWLSGMANNCLCQTAIAAQVRGPNMHMVGDAMTVALSFTVLGQVLRRGAATYGLLVAFDPPEGVRFAAPDSVDSRAASLLVGLDGGRRLEVLDVAAGRGMRAVDFIDAVIVASRSAAGGYVRAPGHADNAVLCVGENGGPERGQTS